MKINLSKKTIFFIQGVAFLLLVSLLLAVLYSFDLINTSLFFIFCQINGFILYGFLAFLFCKTIKRKVMIYALIFSFLVILLYFLYQPFVLSKTILFLLKNLFFLAIILFLKK